MAAQRRHSDCTDAPWGLVAEKSAPRAPQVGVGGSGLDPRGVEVKQPLGTLGDVFVWGIAHSGKAVSWQALSKVTKVTLLLQKDFVHEVVQETVQGTVGFRPQSPTRRRSCVFTQRGGYLKASPLPPAP